MSYLANLKAGIQSAYMFLRKENQSIPDNVLEFMKKVSLKKVHEEEVKEKNEKFLPCPLCDHKPNVNNKGSSVQVECVSCGCFLEVPKHTILTEEQRDTLDPKTFEYSEEAEEAALSYVRQKWNTRT